MSVAKIVKRSIPGKNSVREEMAGHVPERDFMDVQDPTFDRIGRFHTKSIHEGTREIPLSGSLTHSNSSSPESAWSGSESVLLGTDGFDLSRALQDSVTEPGASLVLRSTKPSHSYPSPIWAGTKLFIDQAREYLYQTHATLRAETEIIGAFDTNQQKNGALKSFVPLEEYSDARHRERAQASFVKSRNAYFEKMDPMSPEDAAAPFMEKPEAYFMYRDMDNKCKTDWVNKDAHQLNTSMNTEQPVIEAVNKQYCDQFRYPKSNSPLPRADERRLCRNGLRCVCNTLDTERGYIALEFLTPRENRHFEQSGAYLREVPHLCVDCELAWYTERFYFACRTGDTGVRSAINRFRVICEDGGYSKRTMLPPMIGTHTLSGLVGMVPTFNENYRSYALVENTTNVYRIVEVNVGF